MCGACGSVSLTLRVSCGSSEHVETMLVKDYSNWKQSCVLSDSVTSPPLSLAAQSRRSGDNYVPYNKPGGVSEWVRRYVDTFPPEQRDSLNTTVVVMDPDMFFTGPFEYRAKRNHPMSGQVRQLLRRIVRSPAHPQTPPPVSALWYRPRVES
jgi:hypothetical protein